MAAIVYLDIDDEITSAAARIRESVEARLAIVLPVGSRVSTSRINFRLLAREAQSYGRDLAIVAPEAGTRALAASAGLAAFTSVDEYDLAVEEAEADAAARSASPDGSDGSGGTGGSGGPPPSSGGRGDAGSGTPRQAGRAVPRASKAAAAGSVAGAASTAGRAASPPVAPLTGVRPRSGLPEPSPVVVREVPPETSRRRGPSAWIIAGLGILLIVLLGAGAGAWVVLPTATVVVHNRPEPVGPMLFTVRADPLEVNVDEDAGVMPAQIVTFDLSVSDEFPATGKKITETAASGTVRWTNCDPTRAYTIPSGTLARTSDGIGFKTTEAVFLPVAILTGNPPSITCQSRVVTATAVNPGVEGNVAAGRITVVPSAYNSVVIRVTNPEALDGGTHVEKPIVAQKDVDAAVATLTAAIADQFAADVADPAQAPEGTTIYPATKSMSAAQPTVDPATLVGQTGETFTLGMTGSGTITAVGTAAVEQLAQARIRRAVATDRSLVADLVKVDVGAGRVDGSAVLFPVTARAEQVGALDAAAIRAAVKGLSVDEARTRLRDYGDATVDTWPGWVTTITTVDFRLAVSVVDDVPTEPITGPVVPATQAPAPSPRPTLPAVRPSATAPAPSGT